MIPMKTRDALSRLLQAWEVTPLARPGFCAAVFRRIRQLTAQEAPEAKKSHRKDKV